MRKGCKSTATHKSVLLRKWKINPQKDTGFFYLTAWKIDKIKVYLYTCKEWRHLLIKHSSMGNLTQFSYPQFFFRRLITNISISTGTRFIITHSREPLGVSSTYKRNRWASCFPSPFCRMCTAMLIQCSLFISHKLKQIIFLLLARPRRIQIEGVICTKILPGHVRAK